MIAVLVYKTLNDLLPVYLAEDCQLVSVTGRRLLRLLDIDMSLAQRPNTRLGDRSFLLLDLAYGTVCQPSCKSRTLHSDSFDEHSKCICLAAAPSDCFSCTVYKFAYLLTYLYGMEFGEEVNPLQENF